jgi:FixJ family two-component response regulator
MSIDATVFVVDDDLGALRSMRWLLESEGLRVETFSSSRDFLAGYHLDRPHCLVLDLRMPEMDGLELQERLASQGSDPPIIFVSGHGDLPQCARAMRQGAVDFLEKPVDDEVFLSRVQHAIDADRRRRLEPSHTDVKARLDRLTPREREVKEMLHMGKSIKVIAAELSISFQTAAKHRARVLDKLEVENEAELVRLLLGAPPIDS